MMLLKKTAIAMILFSLIAVGAVIPARADAAVLPAFGGKVIKMTYCTCSENFWIWFAPFYLNSTVPTTGALVWGLGSIGYSHYVPVPMGYVLGTFVPGVQACWMYAGYFCFPLPSAGMISVMTGTSLAP